MRIESRVRRARCFSVTDGSRKVPGPDLHDLAGEPVEIVLRIDAGHTTVQILEEVQMTHTAVLRIKPNTVVGPVLNLSIFHSGDNCGIDVQVPSRKRLIFSS